MKPLSEFLGTFILVFTGTGAIVIHQEGVWEFGQLGIAIGFGIGVALGITLFGRTSGAHMSPAVTIALALAKKFSWKEVPSYIVAQLLGASFASWTLHRFFLGNELLGTTLPSGTTMESFYLEFGLTFFLMLGVLLVSMGKSREAWLAPLLLGTIVGLEAYFAGPICGASMNPARSFGPALVSGHFEHLWLYIAAPIGAAVLIVLLYRGFVKST